MASKKSSLEKSTTDNKTFNYTNKGVNLNFTLRIDNTSELKAFLTILLEAVKDVDDQLKGMKN